MSHATAPKRRTSLTAAIPSTKSSFKQCHATQENTMPSQNGTPVIFPGLSPSGPAGLYVAMLHSPSAPSAEDERCQFCAQDTVDVARPYAVIYHQGRRISPVCMVCLARNPAWWMRTLHSNAMECLISAGSLLPSTANIEARWLEVESVAFEAQLASDCAGMLIYGIDCDPAMAAFLSEHGITVRTNARNGQRQSAA